MSYKHSENTIYGIFIKRSPFKKQTEGDLKKLILFEGICESLKKFID